MLRGSKSGRSLLGKVLDLDSHQSQSHPRQQARTRRSCRPSPTVPKGGRREAPGPPPGLGPATATCPHISPAAPTNNGPIADRSQQRHRRRGPGLVFRTLRRPVWRRGRRAARAGQRGTPRRGRSVYKRPAPPARPPPTPRRRATAGGGRAWFSQPPPHPGAPWSRAPTAPATAPHMVEDVLKTKSGPRRTGHTTRRAA